MRNQEIEDLVEQLAVELGRGLSLEDLDGLLLAYSANQSHADRVRVNFLLSKRVPADVSAWQLSHGIAAAVRPVVVPANAALGMLGRVCVPLLVRGFRVGYLWVQQDSQDQSATAILAQLPHVRDSVELLATLLLDSNTAESSQRRAREQQFLAAVDGDRHAIDVISEWPKVRQRGPWQAATVYSAPGPGPAPDPDRRTARDPLAAVLVHRSAGLQASVGVDDALFSAGLGTHTVMLFRAVQRRTAHADVLARYAAELSKRTGAPASNAVMGIGEPFSSLRQLPAACRESRIAAQATAVDPGLGAILDVRGAGVYEVLAGGAADPDDSVYYRLLRDRDDAAELFPVLELMYDSDGAVAGIAGQLHLHRSTVYNRLSRVRGIIGADPLAGRVRLELHLALKAARWAGRPRL
ncbi:PucR family transcriptional regulator [Arthrobacter livingstonensis]|uniref:PucR family transcriptional regulator n=1 Tax=Arthrobacter livingstonensis TaxID=670078 RepID=A0A2V5LLB9_9MICC|nr:PucR family transcriptional regulator [Arthrobacter livingstonensis]PYI68220.1 PucR family transcriptional regulator [Arthrobacter livingstonensis]